MKTAIGHARKIYENCRSKNPTAAILMTILAATAILSLLMAIITYGHSFENMLYSYRDSYWDDFFDSIYFSYEDPYTVSKVLYPPLITIAYSALADFLIPRVQGYTPYDPNWTDHRDLYSNVLRDSPIGATTYILLTVVAVAALIILSVRILRSKGYGLNPWIIAVLIAASYPFVFAVDRGNSIIYAAVLSLFFVYGYKSPNGRIRFASYLCIALAASIKVYPAVLLVLLIRERRWKDFAVSATMVLVLLTVPFVFTDGTPLILLDTMLNHAHTTAGSNGLVNINDWINLIFGPFVSDGTEKAISFGITALFEFFLLWRIVFDTRLREWEMLLLASSMFIFGPGVGAAYLLTFAAIPLLWFISDKGESRKCTVLLAVGFAVVFCLFPWFDGLRHLQTSVRATVLLLMTLFVASGGPRIMEKTLDRRRDASECKGSAGNHAERSCNTRLSAAAFLMPSHAFGRLSHEIMARTAMSARDLRNGSGG